jgi:hypothetical protein
MIVAFRVITGTSVHFLTTFHSLKISIKKFLQSLSNERICKIHHGKILTIVQALVSQGIYQLH